MHSLTQVGRRNTARVALVAALLATLVAPVAAQDAVAPDTSLQPLNPAAVPVTSRALLRTTGLSHFRTHDARSLNQFEPPKDEGAAYQGFALEWGAAFTQQFQALRHTNGATPNVVSGVDVNRPIRIGSGFNNAEANLYMDAQLAKGIRVALTSYLSSRHHNETWVKDGYLLIDGSPWENATLDRLFDVLTLRVGHFEINYGDMHFRRSDNGQAMLNPLVGNLLMDAFTTEIGGEAYLRGHDLLGMVAVTGGEVRGNVTKPEQRSPSYMAKLGVDKQLKPTLRARLTGSMYLSNGSINNTLYTGSRSGSRYYYVLENPSATEAAQAWSGDVRPGFSNRVRAWVVNPFIKCHGLELFGNIEEARGRAANEASKRTWKQYAGEGLYRLFDNQVYVVGRYGVAKGKLQGITQELKVDRTQAGAGWFLTNNLEAKLEWVQQKYYDFPASDIRNGAKFNGAMFEAVVSF